MFDIVLFLAEDIYTAAGLEFTYQNGYLHGSPSRFSAKSAIYTAAGCQHKIAINTAAVPEPIQIYTRQPCIYPLPHEVAIYTAVIQDTLYDIIYIAAVCI